MKIVDEVIYYPLVCALIGQAHLKLTPEIKKKTKEALLGRIKEGRNYFYFGTLGPWERFCFEELKKLQKEYTDIRLVHFRLDGERTFTEEEAEAFEKTFGSQNQKQKPYLVFDGIYDCRDKLYMDMFPMVSFDRMRTLLKHSGICLGWFETEPEEAPPKEIEKIMKNFELLDYQPDPGMTMLSFAWAQGMRIPTINLAKPTEKL